MNVKYFLTNVYSFFPTDYKEMPFKVDTSNKLNSVTLLVSFTVCSNPKPQFFLV